MFHLTHFFSHQVISKIIKHGSEAPSAFGLLIGIDLDGTLEVSNSFPLPHVNEEDEKTNKSAARYQAQMLRSLKEVQSDDAVVGFYQSNTLGAFFNRSLLDLQASHQKRLRHGGIVVVHGASISLQSNLFLSYSLPQMLRRHRVEILPSMRSG